MIAYIVQNYKLMKYFFLHLIGESNILLKYSNYIVLIHFHGVSMNNLG